MLAALYAHLRALLPLRSRKNIRTQLMTWNTRQYGKGRHVLRRNPLPVVYAGFREPELSRYFDCSACTLNRCLRDLVHGHAGYRIPILESSIYTSRAFRSAQQFRSGPTLAYTFRAMDMTFDAVQMGARLREARRAKNLTQEHVADILGLEKATISHWELGRHAPSFEALTKLVTLYGRSLSWLLVGHEIGGGLMTEEGYELARAWSSLPTSLQQFIVLATSIAEQTKAQFPDNVIAEPTLQTWLDFAKALDAAFKRN